MSQFTFEQIKQAGLPQNENLRKEIVSFFLLNGYLQVVDIPDLMNIQAKLYKELECMNQQYSYKEMIYSNLGIEKQNESFVYANNIFPLQNEELVKKVLKIKDEESPEILQRVDVNQDVAKSEKDFANLSRQLFILLLKLIFTNQSGQAFVNQDPRQQDFELLKIVTQSFEKSEVQKLKSIVDFTEDSNTFKRFISPDFGLGSLISLSTLDFTEQNNKEKENKCFIIQKSDNEQTAIHLKSTDAILTCGEFLSELSQGVIKKPTYFISTQNTVNCQNQQINQQFFYPNFNFGDLLQSDKQGNNQQPLGLYSLFSKILVSDWIYKHHQKMIEFQANEYIQTLHQEQLFPQISVTKKSFLKQENQIECFHFNLIDSTMNIAKYWKKIYVTEKINYAFLADQQFKGQGENNNIWISPKGNCYVTFLVKFDSLLCYCLPQLSAISVIETLDLYIPQEKKQIQPVLKWINDIFMNEKKISGVLCKIEDQHVSIGIGVNLNHTPAEIAESTCLKNELCQQDDINIFEFVQNLWINLSNNLQKVVKQNSFHAILDTVRERMMYLNQKVKIYDLTLTNVLQEGIFKGLNEYGNAQLQSLNDPKEIEAIYEGRMRHF
ncbi:hypothetical protein ABPG72_011345 [Tetrahymena utriculariae]